LRWINIFYRNKMHHHVKLARHPSSAKWDTEIATPATRAS